MLSMLGMHGCFNILKKQLLQYTNKIKPTNLVIISIDVENTFDKIQHSFITKALNKQNNFLNLIKDTYQKTTNSVLLYIKKD